MITNTSAKPESSPIAGLPVARLLGHVQKSSVHYVVTTIDNKGRLADQSPLRILGWQPEAPITIKPLWGEVIVVARSDGPDAVTRQGHLRLPASVRHSCRLTTGARVLIAALLEQELLLAYPSSTVDSALLAYHLSTRAGEHR
jgi:hypothetical protein